MCRVLIKKKVFIMKKNVLTIVASVIFAGVMAFNASLSLSNNAHNNLTMDNIQALSNCEMYNTGVCSTLCTAEFCGYCESNGVQFWLYDCLDK